MCTNVACQSGSRARMAQSGRRHLKMRAPRGTVYIYIFSAPTYGLDQSNALVAH